MTDPQLQQVLRINVVDANGTPLHNSVVKTYLLETNDLISTAYTTTGPVTVQLNKRSDLRVVVTYENETVEQKVDRTAQQVTIPFINVRVLSGKERWANLVVGVLFVLLIVVLASIFPDAKGLQQFAYRAVLAVGIGLIFTGVSGFLKTDIKLGQVVVVGATGAAAAFALIYLVNPPGL